MYRTNLSGQVFGRLTVIKFDDSEYRGNSRWTCECVCGNKTSVVNNRLTTGKTKSCGCLSRELAANRKRTHGLSKTPEYYVWKTLKARCYNANNHKHESYGNRGISVCDRWIDSFANFISDMGKRPTSSHSIERIDNDGNYSPDNCKWATLKEQANNKRSSRFIEHNGVTLTLNQWARKLGIARTTLRYRINNWPIDIALTAPVIEGQKLMK